MRQSTARFVRRCPCQIGTPNFLLQLSQEPFSRVGAWGLHAGSWNIGVTHINHRLPTLSSYSRLNHYLGMRRCAELHDFTTNRLTVGVTRVTGYIHVLRIASKRPCANYVPPCGT